MTNSDDVVVRIHLKLLDLDNSEREVNATKQDSSLKALTLMAIKRERELLTEMLEG